VQAKKVREQVLCQMVVPDLFFKSTAAMEDFLRWRLQAFKDSAYNSSLDGALAQPVRATES
jgi:hypothetical protein